MKKVLGLDLGVGSIGWSAIMTDDEEQVVEILGLGSRVVPLTSDETTGFSKGNGESVSKQRTANRSMRRGIDRFQQRRKRIGQLLERLGMTFPREMLKLDPMALWGLRASAAEEGHRVSLPELGRIILHINSRRGYRHSKDEATADNKQSDYLSQISSRANEAKKQGQTPGQYFACRLRRSEITTQGGKVYSYRIKEQVFPRNAYEEELHRILSVQQEYYPEILTDSNIAEIEDAVFFQRPLKSCKHLVSLCEFESREITTPDGKKKLVGPRVAPVSSPLFQVERIWEAINNIVLKNHNNRRRRQKASDSSQLMLFGDDRKMAYEYHLTQKEREAVFEFLNTHEQMKGSDLLKILGLKKDDGFAVPANIVKGLKGNTTRMALARALDGVPDKDKLLSFDLHTEESGYVDTVTGEVMVRVSTDYLRQPLYRLWHTIYSISDKDELKKAMQDKFGITNETVLDNLYKIDFHGQGYGNKSAKFICKLIPYLQSEGLGYANACERVGTHHSDSMTSEENAARELLDTLPLLKKGELRQPVVEKILNQMINLVNEAMSEYGRFDEIRIELARELKRSKDERLADYNRNSAREKERKDISQKIEEMGLRPSANKIQKYRMWQESERRCMYCGQTIDQKEFLLGIDAEKEHVIPRSIFFDDSFSNKVCACRECNHKKGQMTGYDFMESKGDDALQQYVERVERLYDTFKKSHGKSGISKTKHDRLLTTRDDIPQDFIERDLRQTQYISRKSMEILRGVCRNVYATSGAVTDFFRHAWGYDEILHRLNLPRYSEAGQTEQVEYSHHGQTHTEERIAGWTKRLDHRHHAIDALTIALMRQDYIQRLNTLNTQRDSSGDTGDEYAKLSVNLEKWAAGRLHFPVAQVRAAVERIAVSFKAGRRLTTPGKRYVQRGGKRVCVQQGLTVPRGPLTEESVYGVNRTRRKDCPLKALFANPTLICDSDIRAAVERRLGENDHDIKKAVASCKRNPLTADSRPDPIKQADMWKEDYVIRYPLSAITYKKIASIVDGAVKKAVAERFREVGNDDKAFVKSLSENPLYLPGTEQMRIKSVRCTTGLRPDSMTVVRRAGADAIGYAKLGSNHHVALYTDSEGAMQECVVPFAVAVERRKHRLPVIVTDPDALWIEINDRKENFQEDFLVRFPEAGWTFVTSMQVNEMFIIGLSDDKIRSAASAGRIDVLASHLYRVQKLSSWYYDFKLHTSTISDTTNEQMKNKNYISIRSSGRWKELNPMKVKVDRLGRIILPDKYTS